MDWFLRPNTIYFVAIYEWKILGDSNTYSMLAVISATTVVVNCRVADQHDAVAILELGNGAMSIAAGAQVPRHRLLKIAVFCCE